MGVGSFLGIGKEVAAPIKALDELFTSDDERLTRQEALERISQNPALWQTETNKEEAKHSNVFVAGWRPFIGWICGCGLAYHFIVQPIILLIFAVFGFDVKPPVFDMETLFTLLFGLLGLGGLRTIEKTKGVAR